MRLLSAYREGLIVAKGNWVNCRNGCLLENRCAWIRCMGYKKKKGIEQYAISAGCLRGHNETPNLWRALVKR